MFDLTDPWVFGTVWIGGFLLINWVGTQLIQRRVVSREGAVIVRRSRAQPQIVALDTPKVEAVEVLVHDGWKRKAAVSALESNGWRGYPSVPDMVLNAWKTMPGYRQ